MRCEAFDAAFALMKPGVDSAELEQAINNVYRREGYSNHGQVSLHAHGTGVNAVEAPTCPGAEPACWRPVWRSCCIRCFGSNALNRGH